MSANAENIKTQVNKYIRNYAADAFANQRLNAILLQIVDLADAASGGGGNGSVVVKLSSVNFSTPTDCPLSTLAGKNIAVFFNDNSKFLDKDTGEWTDLPGGGFRILLPDFDASKNNYQFYAFTL